MQDKSARSPIIYAPECLVTSPPNDLDKPPKRATQNYIVIVSWVWAVEKHQQALVGVVGGLVIPVK